MKTIWKFKLSINDRVEIPMPRGAKILTAQMQKAELHLWALVDTDQPNETRMLAVIGTGQPADLPAYAKHIATVQHIGAIGVLVMHVFDLYQK